MADQVNGCILNCFPMGARRYGDGGPGDAMRAPTPARRAAMPAPGGRRGKAGTAGGPPPCGARQSHAPCRDAPFENAGPRDPGKSGPPLPPQPQEHCAGHPRAKRRHSARSLTQGSFR